MTDNFCIYQFVKTIMWLQYCDLILITVRKQSKCALTFLLPQQSTGTVKWQQWLQDSGVKLRQILKVVVHYREEKENDDSVELEDGLSDLQWYWAQQQHQTQDLETLQEWREWLSPCEASANTQVQCISSSHDNTNHWQELCWLSGDASHLSIYLSRPLNSVKMIRMYKTQPDRNGNTCILNLHSTDYIAKTNRSKHSLYIFHGTYWIKNKNRQKTWTTGIPWNFKTKICDKDSRKYF